MDAHRQILRPDDRAIRGLALGDNLTAGQDFPGSRQLAASGKPGPRGMAGADHDRLVGKRRGACGGRASRMAFSAAGIRHTAVTLTVDIFGQDSEVFGFGVKVHSARGLHATGRRSREIV